MPGCRHRGKRPAVHRREFKLRQSSRVKAEGGAAFEAAAPARAWGEAWEGLEAWLAGLVHESAGADLAQRARHERFIAARSVTAALGFAALPPVLLWRGVPSTLEALALVSLVAPMLAVVVLHRFGGLARAQALASLSLLPFAAGLCAALGGAASPAALVLLALPFDGVTSGSWRAFLAACGVALAGLVVGLLPAPGLAGWLGGRAELAVTGAAVAAAVALGHAVAMLAVDLRLKALVRVASRSGEAHESAALQAIDDLVTWHDRNGAVLRASASAQRLLGVAPKALEGRGLFSRVLVADRPAYLKAISDAAVSDAPVGVELRLTVEDNRTFVTVEMRANRLAQGGRTGACVVAVARDITAHRQETQALAEARLAAEDRGARRARLLEEAAESLRAPLGTVVDFATLLTPDVPFATGRADPRPAYAERVLGAGERLDGLVAILGELSAIENGRYPFAPAALDLAALVEERCDEADAACRQRNVILVQDVGANLAEVKADRRALKRLLELLVSDAIAAAPEGARVALRARAEPRRMVLSVIGPRLEGAGPDGLVGALARALAGLHGGSITPAQVRGLWSVSVTLPREAQGAAPARLMDGQVHVLAATETDTPIRVASAPDLDPIKRAG